MPISASRPALALLLAAALLLPAAASHAQEQTAPHDEAEEVLKDAKKNDPVTRAEYEKCLQQWEPQTQMTREQWAASCRATLKYFPEQ